MRDFKKTAAIQERMVAANDNDVDAKIELAATESKIADVMVKQGEYDRAISIYQKTIAVVAPFAYAAHALVKAQYAAADAYFGLSTVLQKQAAVSGNSAARPASASRPSETKDP